MQSSNLDDFYELIRVCLEIGQVCNESFDDDDDFDFVVISLQ